MPVAPSPIGQEKQEKTARGRVLIVEDAMIRRFVAGILRRDGYAVVETERAAALRTLRQSPGAVSLLITNGPADFLEFADTVPLIYVAAFPDPELAHRFRSCRMLRKPFRPEELASYAAELSPPAAA